MIIRAPILIFVGKDAMVVDEPRPSFRKHMHESRAMLSLNVCRSSLLLLAGRTRASRMALYSSSVSQNRATGKKPVNGAGEEVYYEQRGSGAHPILCISGALGTANSDFFPQLEYFGREKSSYTIVGYDPMGYGNSRPPERNFESKTEIFFERDASDGHSLMQALSFPKFSVLGWSDGGIAAMILAARFPEAVQKLVVWGANSYISDEDISLFENTRDVKKWSARMREPMEAMYGVTYFPKLWSDWLDAMIAIKLKTPDGDLCKKDLPKIKCPTLVVHGAKDAMVPQFHPDYIHGNIAESRLVVMPDGKHNLHWKYAKEFNELVDNFLSE